MIRSIGGYNIVRKLGKGGMASVFEVEHPTLGAHLAMKVFEAKGERAEFLRGRFLAEGCVLARLEHPNLVKVHECGFDEAIGAAYITMDPNVSAGIFKCGRFYGDSPPQGLRKNCRMELGQMTE